MFIYIQNIYERIYTYVLDSFDYQLRQSRFTGKVSLNGEVVLICLAYDHTSSCLDYSLMYKGLAHCG